MKLISEQYREANKQLYEVDECYGMSGHREAPRVAKIAHELQTVDILDYGCGRRTLEEALGIPIKNYDPCIPGLDTPPEPADIVVCSDVLEHIEPECLDAVLADIYRLTKKVAYLLIANRPALKALPDGRNAHLIQEGPEWWLPKLWQVGFLMARFQSFKSQHIEIAFLVIANKEGWWLPTAKQ